MYRQIMITTNSRQSTTQAGVSLVELLVVIVIIGIVSAIAVMNRGQANEQFKRQNVSRELKVAFERARFDSVKRRAQSSPNDYRARVDVNSNSYTLTTFKDVAGTPTAQTVTTALPSGIAIARYDGGTLPLTVNFNMRGETGAGSVPQFRICNNACSGPFTNATSDIVIVTPTGTINLLAGGSGLPSFGLPGGTSVPTTSGVNPDAVLP